MHRDRTNWHINVFRCEKCNHIQSKRTNFCTNCGRQAIGGPLRAIESIEWLVVDDDGDAYDCSGCGAMVSKKYNFCPHCGGLSKEVKLNVQVL